MNEDAQTAIRVYLAKHKLTTKQLAIQLDIAPGYMSAIKNGTFIPSRKIIRKLKEVTNGEIDLTQQVVQAAA